MFGEAFTDHMVLMRWTATGQAAGEWGPIELRPFGPLSLSPATLALHYGQSIFEAFKAFTQADGSVGVFRIERNAARIAMADELRKNIDPYIAAGHAAVDDVIDPADTRHTIHQALQVTRTKQVTRPWRKHGVLPV